MSDHAPVHVELFGEVEPDAVHQRLGFQLLPGGDDLLEADQLGTGEVAGHRQSTAVQVNRTGDAAQGLEDPVFEGGVHRRPPARAVWGPASLARTGTGENAGRPSRDRFGSGPTFARRP